MRVHRILAVVVLSALVGCQRSSELEAAKLRAELEASRAELARARAEMELARRQHGSAPGASSQAEADGAGTRSLADRLLSLQDLYNKSAITVDEWGRLKRQTIEQIPAQVGPGEKHTLGDRLMATKVAWERSAVTSDEWTQIKSRLIAQKANPLGTPAPSLEDELSSLQKAWNASVINSDEWSKAKSVVAERATLN